VEVSTEGNGTYVKVYQSEMDAESTPTPVERDLLDKIGRLRGGGPTIIIDGYRKTSYGPFVNDPGDESLCNAIIVQRNGKKYVEATRELYPNEEISISYGGSYWANRFHLYPDPARKLHSFYQLQLIQTGEQSQTRRHSLLTFSRTTKGWTCQKI